MGYRHYIGYIPKKDMDEVMKEVERLKGLIGQPRNDDPDDNYDMYDITSYLRDKATTLAELGKLYYLQDNTLYDTLYKNKGEDYSNDDTEFFFVNGNKLLLDVSYAEMNMWTNYMKECRDVIQKVRKEEELTEDDKLMLSDIYRTFDREIETLDFANGRNRVNWFGNDLEPYYSWQFNYEAVEMFKTHKNFDYENNQICVFAY